MIDWPMLKLPPINLHNAPKMVKTEQEIKEEVVRRIRDWAFENLQSGSPRRESLHKLLDEIVGQPGVHPVDQP